MTDIDGILKDVIDDATPVGDSANSKGKAKHRPSQQTGQPETKPNQSDDDSREPTSLTPNPFADLPDYPIDALPPVLQSAAKEVARFCKIPIDSAATIALSMAATAIGKKARIAERPGLYHWPALFFSLIAKTGERKSPPFRYLQHPFTEFIDDGQTDYQEAKALYEQSKRVIAGRRNKLAKDAENATAQEERRRLMDEMSLLSREHVPPPRPLRRFTSDFTEPSLYRMMDESGGEYAIQSGEGRTVYDLILGKHSGDGCTGDGMILAGISGDTITRDRIGSADSGGEERREILSPCLNVCVMIQQDKHLKLATNPSLRTSGVIGRIFPVWLPSLVGYRTEEKHEPGLQDAELAGYENALKFLLNAKVKTPHLVNLQGEAKEARRCFHNDFEIRMREGAELEDVADITSKFCTQTTKIALVLQMLKKPELLIESESALDAETWYQAERLGQHYLKHATKTQRFADDGAGNEAAWRLWKWLKKEVNEGRNKAFTAQDFQQRSTRPRPKAKELTTILETLIEHRLITERYESGTSGRLVYVVNMEAVERDL
ncbi:MAG: DUF3987 domain-containing protein [Candidatus Methylumidiphilus sp.]